MKKILLSLIVVFAVVTFVACEKENIVLKYASQDLGTVAENNVERRLLEAYEVEHPNVDVQIIERPTIPNPTNPEEQILQDWNEFLMARATTGDFPDVFSWFESAASSAQREWSMDIKSIVDNDDEFQKVPKSLRDVGLYNGEQHTVVSAQFFWGYYINKTLFEDAGVEVPTYGITLDELLGLIADVYDAHEGSIVGISGVADDLQNWLPSNYDASMGYATFSTADGFHWNSDAYKNAVTKQLDIIKQPYCLDSIADADRTSRFGFTGPYDLFANNKLAVLYDASWNVANFTNQSSNQELALPLLGKAIDFIGTPSVVTNGVKLNRIPSIADLKCVGNGSTHPEEAFDLLKWMSFGIDGYTKRLEIAKENGFTVGNVPIIDNDNGDLLNAFLAGSENLVEYKKFLDNHTDFIPESNKIAPGFTAARWTSLYGPYEINGTTADRSVGDMLWNISHGFIPGWQALLPQLQTLSNQAWQDAIAALEEE